MFKIHNLQFLSIARSQVSVKSDNVKFKMHLDIQLNPLEEKIQVKYKIQSRLRCRDRVYRYNAGGGLRVDCVTSSL